MIFAVVLMLPNVTNAAVSNHILTSYFENLAQGYKDYGFVYSFSASVLDRGMSAPEEYSEESVDAVLAKLDEGDQDNPEQSASLEGDADESAEKSASLVKNEAVRTSSAETAQAETDAPALEETEAETDASALETLDRVLGGNRCARLGRGGGGRNDGRCRDSGRNRDGGSGVSEYYLCSSGIFC